VTNLKTSKSEAQNFDFWNVFRELPESYLLFEANDPIFTIVDLNKAREKLTGIRRKDAVGKPLFNAYPDTGEVSEGAGQTLVHRALQEVLHTKKPVKLGAFRYNLPDQPNKFTERFWQSSYIPMKNQDGKITHILAATQDVTDQKATEVRISSAEERLDAALAIGKVGSWAWDVEEDLVVADSTLAHMFGISVKRAAKGLAIESFVQAIHADDRPHVAQAIRKSIGTGVEFEEEYRTLTTTGRVRWVLARGKVQNLSGRRIFTGVIVDVTERRDLQAQIELARQQDTLNRQAAKMLQQRNEELEAVSRTKDEFVALASHQLRTPATAVKQYLGMVLQGYVGDISELQREMLDKAFESNERQIEIINQILNAARVDTGRLMMTHLPLDVASLVGAIAEDMQRNMEQHKHQFLIKIPKTPLRVVADRGYLRMAIENIVDNACLYTPDGGRVGLTVQVRGDWCVISISDTGVGIKQADLSRLFIKFSRIHNALSVQAGGSGIGLYLADKIVKLHGGSITVTSKLGSGTTFAISLPLVHNKVINGAKVLTESMPEHM
jgi:two-component system sensor histidine kinase VicK